MIMSICNASVQPAYVWSQFREAEGYRMGVGWVYEYLLNGWVKFTGRIRVSLVVCDVAHVRRCTGRHAHAASAEVAITNGHSCLLGCKDQQLLQTRLSSDESDLCRHTDAVVAHVTIPRHRQSVSQLHSNTQKRLQIIRIQSIISFQACSFPASSSYFARVRPPSSR